MQHLIAVVGPTATGKSDLALSLARRFGGEIVSADSRQVYRFMDIGTAKPSPDELSRIPHHLIDIVNPDEDFSLAQYQELAFQSIDDIQQRGKPALLVGGSGLYVRAVLEGWGIPSVAPDPEFRQRLEERAAAGEADELYRELSAIDPEAARRIDGRNTRRVIRGLEISNSRGAAASGWPGNQPPPYKTLIIGLTVERSQLYRRIDDRVERMIEDGLVEEVKKLREAGYGMDLPSMSGIGYRQIGIYLNGSLSLEAAVYRMKTETHRLVRKQYNWFKPDDKRINWFDITGDYETEVSGLVTAHLSG